MGINEMTEKTKKTKKNYVKITGSLNYPLNIGDNGTINEHYTNTKQSESKKSVLETVLIISRILKNLFPYVLFILFVLVLILYKCFR